MPQEIRQICGQCRRSFTVIAVPSKAPKHCSDECRSLISAASMRKVAREHREKIVDRMRHRNPMQDPAIRARISATLKRIGHKPRILGGNGRGPTRQELSLSQALDWPTNVIVGTGSARRMCPGLPKHYKIDLGNRAKMIAIEIDGQSHNSPHRREADARKTRFLESLGWLVIRFKNKEVDENLHGCVQKITTMMASMAE